MSDTVFTTLWAIYGISSLLAFWLLWSLTKWNGKARYLSGLLRVLFIAVMATPATLSSVPELMAPAFVVIIFDFLQGYDGVFDAAVNLGAAAVIGFVLYSIVFLIFLFVHSRTKS